MHFTFGCTSFIRPVYITPDCDDGARFDSLLLGPGADSVCHCVMCCNI